MTRSPVLTSYWDHKRQERAHKISIEGTSKFILLTDGTLRDLQAQINEAAKGSHDDRTDT